MMDGRTVSTNEIMTATSDFLRRMDIKNSSTLLVKVILCTRSIQNLLSWTIPKTAYCSFFFPFDNRAVRLSAFFIKSFIARELGTSGKAGRRRKEEPGAISADLIPSH